MPDTLQFPLNLDGEGDIGGKPFVKFRAIKTGDQITLPIPAGVTISDGANYSSIDLGGAASVAESFSATKAAEEARDSGAGVLGSLKAGAKSLFGNDKASLVKEAITAGEGLLTMGGLAGAEALGLGADSRDKLLYATKKALNPNTRTTFQGNTIRSYSFEFTMVGRSVQEAQAIRDIHNLFRQEMYPIAEEDRSTVLLEYPTTWELEFVEGPRGARNKFIPTPLECYLTAFTSNFNPSGHMFRVDGSPTEISVSLQFTETKVPLKQEIIDLNPR